MEIKEKIENLIKSKIEREGYKLIKVELKYQRGGQSLIITIDKEGGVSVEDCAKVSRMIDPILEKEDLIKTRYFLIVSSPGIK